jgi:hypothetical protein
MGTATAGLAALVLIIGLVAGWFANRAHAAHGDLKSTRGRLPGYRRTRARSGVIAVILLIVAVIALKDLAHP